MNSVLSNRTKVGNAMIQFGGSFIENIGRALLCADEENTVRIYNAFQEEWEEYEALANCLVG